MHRQGDIFGRASLPAALDRKQRVALLKQFSDAVLANETPPAAAAMFVASAIAAFLAQGGDLCADFLQIKAPQGCHDTPQRLARKLDEDE